MEGIDQESTSVCFLDDGDSKTYIYLDDTQVKDFDSTPKFAFLPDFFVFAKGLNIEVEEAMHYIDRILEDSPPFKLEVCLTNTEKPRPPCVLPVSRLEDVAGVKELIKRLLFPGELSSLEDISLTFHVKENLRCVSPPVKEFLSRKGRQWYVSQDVTDWRVKIFLEDNKLTSVDARRVNAWEAREARRVNARHARHVNARDAQRVNARDARRVDIWE
ncbi:hypothetical protein BGZ82_002810 [Podila clonocystis]|nr:hypothetical protein BGZ82_002810 [Podila clonocystis]